VRRVWLHSKISQKTNSLEGLICV